MEVFRVLYKSCYLGRGESAMAALEQHSEDQLQASIAGYSLVPASKSYVVYADPSAAPEPLPGHTCRASQILR